MDQTNSRSIAGAVAVLVLAGLAFWSVWAVRPPAPLAADAPGDEFSAGRAYAHVQTLGEAVHVAGSKNAAAAREYIVGTLKDYGLDPQVQDAVGADDALGEGYTMAHVRNVVAELKGTASTGRLILVAHYDSVQVSYGGNDDGAGVATLLETARILTSGEKPRNDIVFVFTDAEEACLCGAEAFVSQHALAKDGGVVLNFEARGSSGPAIMFETTRDNADVVGVYGDVAPYPVATSFAVEVYRILPNDTDFSPFRDAGRFTGLNTAYIDGSAVYHTPEDRPEYMDQASLQHHGSNALALTQAFASRDLSTLEKPSAGDSTYFPVLGYLVRYPGWLVWPVAILALLAVVALSVTVSGIVRGRASFGRQAAAFGLGLLPLALAPILAQVYWLVLVAIRPGYRQMIDPWRPEWFRAAVVALVATLLLLWYALWSRRLGRWAMVVAGFGWLAVLGVLLAAFTPGGSYLAALPALFGALAGIVAVVVRTTWAKFAALTVGGAVAVVILAPTVMLFFPALGLATGAAAALFATMLGLALVVLYPRRAMWPALGAAVLTLVFTGVGLAVDRFDAKHPAPEQLMYALDTDNGQARWVSADDKPGAWAAQYATGTENLEAKFPLLHGDIASGPAQAATLTAPSLTASNSTVEGTHRTLTLLVKPNRDVRLVYLKVPGAKVTAATVAGRAVPADALGDDFGVLFHAPPADGLTVTLTVEQTSPITVRVMDGSDGLAGLPGFTPRPPDVGVEGSHTSELVLVAKTYTV
ncbi:MAG: M28 family peptidase [Hamadaea sp.]|uniref:M28 family peptidase n=1 Tax=Hamadaea sp. TaxID=2024425 RepID=UPI00183A2B0C|nr:M28 family peptidase [Hamadaea sp.]NUR73709.1 M28 family peptidase [Hamadaea sp.]NUT22559.1 M28 family peptidase [Hamadaea sp.]